MSRKHLQDWDDAFANMAYVDNSAQLPEFWEKRAADYRKTAHEAGRRIDLDVAYGARIRERFDLVWPDNKPKGLAFFVHGGYWMRLNKSHWTDLAEGARTLGWAVCFPSYTLAPEMRISQITQQVSAAINTAAKLVSGPVRLAGHSAGGHLVTRMICEDSVLDNDVASRIEHTLSISGLHDLRPLLNTVMNNTLQLDLAESTSESAALRLPKDNPSLTCWVGGGERPEFIRQSRLMAQMWEGLDAHTDCTVEGDHNHFTVIDGLKSAESPITKVFVGA